MKFYEDNDRDTAHFQNVLKWILMWKLIGNYKKTIGNEFYCLEIISQSVIIRIFEHITLHSTLNVPSGRVH